VGVHKRPKLLWLKLLAGKLSRSCPHQEKKEWSSRSCATQKEEEEWSDTRGKKMREKKEEAIRKK
jgi:hypothetical protein